MLDDDEEQKLVFTVGCGLVAVVLTVKLAFLALIAWGIYELITHFTG